MALVNINTTMGIGEGIMYLIKGSVQFAVNVLDTALGTSFGATDLAAVGIALAVIVFALHEARKAMTQVRAIGN